MMAKPTSPAPAVLAQFHLGMLRAAHGRPERKADAPAMKRGHRLGVKLLRQPIIAWQPPTPPLLRRLRRAF